MGVYGYTKQGDTDYFGNKTTQINRRVFLPSIDEVSAVVNVNDQWEMDKFMRDENGNYTHMWFRDSRDTYQSSAIAGSYTGRSLFSIHVRSRHVNVRPAFVINLNNINYTKEAQPFI